ncbi:MAG: MFS transporter [Corynebacterium glucuronolyticum]|nr:MFS transporter [Corynebacterium glucuronolyticum]MDD7586944.1 MFS transporter [Mycobacteriaceae bacterium]MDY5833602.1 MFS transporter [Corynebacterium glucuronolyticum]
MFLIGFVVALLTELWALTGMEAGFILACSGLGNVLGAVVWGRLADSLARKRSYMWCVILFVTCTELTLLVPDRGWFILGLLRIGVGIGVGGLNISSIPCIQECVPTSKRGLLAGLGSNFIPAGLFLGSLAQKEAGENWRILIVMGCLPILLLLWLATVPESPPFLHMRGETRKARQALAWAMDMDIAQVGWLSPVSESVAIDGGASQADASTETDTPMHSGTRAETKAGTYTLLFTRHWVSLLLVVMGTFSFILGATTVQSWGQTLLKDGFGYSVGTIATMFMLASFLGNLGRLGAAFLADIIGRKLVLFIWGLVATGGCVLASLSDDPGNGLQFFVAVSIILMFGDGAFGILNSHGAEQFPTPIRSTGLGLGYGLGATPKIFGPALVGWLIGSHAVAGDMTLSVIKPAFTFYGACLFVGAVTYLFTKEKRGVPLD